MARWTKQEGGLAPIACGQLQTAQAREPGAITGGSGPCQYGTTTGAAQGLFAGPQGFCRVTGANLQQAPQVDTVPP